VCAFDAPPASCKHWPMSVAQKAAWWAADYCYVARDQIRALDRRVPSHAFRSGDRAPVVILPGVFEPWRFLLPMIRALHGAGHPVHVIDALEYNTQPIADSAALVSQHLASQQLEGAFFVAHSKGGLIGKHVMAFEAEGWRIRSMVAIATPFNGSSLARYQPTSALRHFSPRDTTLQRLDAERAVNDRIVSIFPSFDPHIPEGCALPLARNVHIDTGGHFRILARRDVLMHVLAVTGQRGEEQADPRADHGANDAEDHSANDAEDQPNTSPFSRR
jgi:hypothetical protein